MQDATTNEATYPENDVSMVMSQSGVARERAIELLQSAKGDVVNALLLNFGHADTTETKEKCEESMGADAAVQAKIAEMRTILDEKDVIFQQYQEQQRMQQQQQQAEQKQQQQAEQQPAEDTASS